MLIDIDLTLKLCCSTKIYNLVLSSEVSIIITALNLFHKRMYINVHVRMYLRNSDHFEREVIIECHGKSKYSVALNMMRPAWCAVKRSE